MILVNLRGSLVQIGVLNGEDVDGSLITRNTQERRVVTETDAEIQSTITLLLLPTYTATYFIFL